MEVSLHATVPSSSKTGRTIEPHLPADEAKKLPHRMIKTNALVLAQALTNTPPPRRYVGLYKKASNHNTSSDRS